MGKDSGNETNMKTKALPSQLLTFIFAMYIIMFICILKFSVENAYKENIIPNSVEHQTRT